MKYLVYAKILGSFLPTKRKKIEDCVIEKHLNPYFLTNSNKPEIPIMDSEMYYFNIENKQRNFIQYPQKPVSTRNFQSEYSIKTEVETHTPSQAVEEAEKRFHRVIDCLSLAIKTTIRNINGKRFRRNDEHYDFEISNIYVKTKGQLLEMRLPRPLINGHNVCPKDFPKNFVAKTKKFLNNRDYVFFKALSYVSKSVRMKDTGNYDQLLWLLNLVKCIELISHSLNIKSTKINPKTNKKVDLTTKELFELAGKKLGVTKESIKYSKKAWDERNKSDVAHANENYTFISINYSKVEGAANEFLIKYHTYLQLNPPNMYTLGGKHGWGRWKAHRS